MQEQHFGKSLKGASMCVAGVILWTGDWAILSHKSERCKACVWLVWIIDEWYKCKEVYIDEKYMLSVWHSVHSLCAWHLCNLWSSWYDLNLVNRCLQPCVGFTLLHHQTLPFLYLSGVYRPMESGGLIGWIQDFQGGEQVKWGSTAWEVFVSIIIMFITVINTVSGSNLNI